MVTVGQFILGHWTHHPDEGSAFGVPSRR